MGFLSVDSGTFGILGVQLSGIYGASVCRLWDIWDSGSSAVGYIWDLCLFEGRSGGGEGGEGDEGEEGVEEKKSNNPTLKRGDFFYFPIDHL